MSANEPTYLDKMLLLVNRTSSRPGLYDLHREQQIIVPGVWTKLGERAIEYAGPVTWEQLSQHICVNKILTVLN